jgi:hypothetical protein
MEWPVTSLIFYVYAWNYIVEMCPDESYRGIPIFVYVSSKL